MNENELVETIAMTATEYRRKINAILTDVQRECALYRAPRKPHRARMHIWEFKDRVKALSWEVQELIEAWAMALIEATPEERTKL